MKYCIIWYNYSWHKNPLNICDCLQTCPVKVKTIICFLFNLLHLKMLDVNHEVLQVTFFSNTLLKICIENIHYIISTHISSFHYTACFVNGSCSHKCLRCISIQR